MNKNLFLKGQNPTKNTQVVKRPKKKRKTDSTFPKTEEKGQQPDTKRHLINGSQSTHIRAQPTQTTKQNPTARGKQTKTITSPHPGHRKLQTKNRPVANSHKSRNQPTMRNNINGEGPSLTQCSVCRTINNLLNTRNT